MPRVLMVDGIVFKIYFADHVPPHVHVTYSEHEELLVIADGSTYAGSLPAAQHRVAVAWIEKNRGHFQAVWDRCNPKRKP